jgi:hypothetical protein
MNLETIEDLLAEIDYLKKKAALVDELLKYYDKELMCFNVPENWKGLNRLGLETLKQTPKTPKHFLNKKIKELLPYSESLPFVNYDKVYETAG